MNCIIAIDISNFYIIALQKSIDKPEEEEEEFNDAVVSMGEERKHNATYSKLNHVYVAGGRAYNALEAMEQR